MMLRHSFYIIAFFVLPISVSAFQQSGGKGLLNYSLKLEQTVPVSILKRDTLLSQQHKINKKALFLWSINTVGYVGSLTYLSQLWYSKYDQTGFHFFNDNDGWMGIDKLGHTLTAYSISRIEALGFEGAGYSSKKAALSGALIGIVFQSSVEFLDGLSEAWGASPGDLIANTSGTGLYLLQELLLQEQLISFKWSYHNTLYAQYRPDKLGSWAGERWLKDYNGQTYWLSANVASIYDFSGKFPDWINLSFGYGADGMLGYSENPIEIDGVLLPPFERYRQYYFSLDIDLTRIKTKSKIVNTALQFFSFVKIPFPALEYNQTYGFRFHGLYF